MNAQLMSLIQIVLGLLLVVVVLLQSNKGTGLGSSFGGDMGFYGTKRGAEKMLFIFTIILAILFTISLLLGVILR